MIGNFTTKIAKKLANLQLAIGLLFIIGLVIGVGTIVEQDQTLNFYKDNYPEQTPLFGFLSWKIITFLDLNEIYTAWWFLLLLFFLATSLLSCTFTTQLPSIKTFKLWKFYTKPKTIKNLGVQGEVGQRLFNTVAYQCNNESYHFFRQKNKGYAYSGLLGRVAPAVVHASIILLLLGSTIGSFGGYIAQAYIPRGEITHVQNLTKFGRLSYVPQGLSVRINDFWITYTKEFRTDQFYSDLSLLSPDGKELKRKTIFVNEPLVFDDLVFYQTDWDIIGLKLRLPNQQEFQLPLKKITKGGRKFWFGSLPIDSLGKSKISIVVNDLQDKLFVYDSKGILLQDLSLGGLIKLDNGKSIKVCDFLASTGLQIKSDPGIQTIYLAFLFLMTSIYVSFFTYSQIWMVEATNIITVGGKSNRAVLFFQQEFRKILKRVNGLDS